MGGFALPLMMGGPMMMAPAIGMGLGFGMGGCCDDILGPTGRGALGGGLVGGLAGGLLGGPGGLIGGAIGGGILGAILGRKRHNHCHHHHQHQFPPPCGQGFGGYGCGGYGGGFPGMGMGGDPYSQDFAAGQYAAGYQAGLQAGGGGGFGGGFGNPWLGGGGGFGGGFPGGGFGGGGIPGGGYGGGYFGNNYGIAPGGCQPPGHGWNGGCCPPQHCRNPHSTGNPGGRLEQCGDGKPITYTTSGGWNVRVDKDKVIITDPTGKQKIEHSGDPHEYVNGKHIKDWEGKDRSIVLPDGTKITMNATGPQGLVTHTSIYDGDQNVQINNEQNRIEHHSYNAYDTRMREAWQHDGETAAVRTSWDGNRMTYDNLYTQDENFNIRGNYRQLAADRGPWWNRPFLGLFNERTKDFYDDPRIGHT